MRGIASQCKICMVTFLSKHISGKPSMFEITEETENSFNVIKHQETGHLEDAGKKCQAFSDHGASPGRTQHAFAKSQRFKVSARNSFSASGSPKTERDQGNSNQYRT